MIVLEALREADIADTIESIPVAMASFRVESPTRFMLHANNHALRSLLQTDGSEAYGRTIPELKFAGKSVLQQLQRACALAFQSRKGQSVERTLRRKDHTRIVVHYTVSPIINRDEVTFVLITTEDISEIVRARRKRQTALARLASTKFVVCAWCSSVRSDQNDWLNVERYVNQNAFKRPAISLCPECQARLE